MTAPKQRMQDMAWAKARGVHQQRLKALWWRYTQAYLSKLFQGEEALHLLQLLTHCLVAWGQIHGTRKGLQAYTTLPLVDITPHNFTNRTLALTCDFKSEQDSPIPFSHKLTHICLLIECENHAATACLPMQHA